MSKSSVRSDWSARNISRGGFQQSPHDYTRGLFAQSRVKPLLEIREVHPRAPVGMGATSGCVSSSYLSSYPINTDEMVHCPECDGEITEESDVEFLDLDAKMAGLFRSSKRFYVVACKNCGAAIGSGVAGGGG